MWKCKQLDSSATASATLTASDFDRERTDTRRRRKARSKPRWVEFGRRDGGLDACSDAIAPFFFRYSDRIRRHCGQLRRYDALSVRSCPRGGGPTLDGHAHVRKDHVLADAPNYAAVRVRLDPR